MNTKAMLAGLAAVVAIGCVTVLADGASGGQARSERAVGGPANTTSLLRSQRTQADEMPLEVAKSPLLEGMGVLPATSRRLERQGGPPAWTVKAANDKLCFISGGSAGCAPSSVLVDRGVLPQIAWARGVLRVEGVAADSVETLRVTFQDGSQELVPVRENAFLLTTTSRIPRRLEWADVHGAQSLAFSLPPDLLSQNGQR